MIKVLVVDDSPTARQAIAAILNSAPGMQVVGAAADGLEAVALAARLKPDVITMDINMPGMDGHQATQQIMAQTPTAIVVVTTVTRQELVHRGLDILLAGALDIVQKPSSLTSQSLDAIRSELIAKVESAAQVKFAARE
ncbi:MAG TPA: response regulator [Anaerolineae bacterium]|nr:response regulator [Anaerolineae bacterium]